jgi:hypothetical protein
VNGPPATGKTTLLRDIVTALVAERARVMAGFDDPEEAFTHSGEKLRAGNAWVHLYKVDKRLRGFEMLVASSNNKEVENVSAELPGRSAIAGDANDLRYFPIVSDALREKETWGLIAAVLGNAANRNRFKQAFWWDDDVGLSTYLAAAAGSRRLDAASRKRAGGEIRSLQREFPGLGIVVSIRRQALDVPISGPAVKIDTLTDGQQREIACALRGVQGEATLDHFPHRLLHAASA